MFNNLPSHIVENYRKNFRFLDDQIYIYLTRRDDTFLSHLVATFTRSIYTHAGIFFHNNFDCCLEAVPGKGVLYHPIENFNRANTIDIFRIYNHKNIDKKTLTLKKNLFFKKVIGKPYDWPSIFGLIFNQKNLHNRDAYFCSELVFKFVEEVMDIHLLKNIEAYEVIPKYLGLSPYLKYVGTIITNSEV